MVQGTSEMNTMKKFLKEFVKSLNIPGELLLEFTIESVVKDELLKLSIMDKEHEVYHCYLYIRGDDWFINAIHEIHRIKINQVLWNYFVPEVDEEIGI